MRIRKRKRRKPKVKKTKKKLKRGRGFWDNFTKTVASALGNSDAIGYY